MRQLRPFQEAALNASLDRFRCGVTNQVIQMATGTGKTVVFGNLPQKYDLGNRRMLVLVHRDELAEQALDKVSAWNPGRSVGIEMGENRADNADIVVGSPQTLGKKGSSRIKKFNPKDFGIIVTDECHHATSQSYMNVFDYFGTSFRDDLLNLGVTATTKRSDGKGLSQAGYQEIVYKFGMLDAVKQGWLARPRGVRIDTKTSLDGIHTLAGDFKLDELSNRVDTETRNLLAVHAWLEKGENRQTVAFAVNIQHAINLANMFKRYGIAAEAIWGADPDRADKLKYHREGALKVLVNCQLLTEGYDDWRLACILMARPTQSELLYTQIVGRGTRIPSDITNLLAARQMGMFIAKGDCLVIDMVDASSKHNLMTLPSLFGLSPNADMKGRDIVTIMEQVDALKAARPNVDVSRIADLDKLRVYAEDVDLFKVEFPPEIEEISKFQWHRAGEDSYVLLLPNREHVCVLQDLLGIWCLAGTINGEAVSVRYGTDLAEAIKDADARVKASPTVTQTLLVRKAKWHDDEPTTGQIVACRQWRIRLPLGPPEPGWPRGRVLRSEDGSPLVTKGEVHIKLNEVIHRAKQAQLNRKKVA